MFHDVGSLSTNTGVAPQYVIGDQPKFTMVVTNIGLVACKRDVGAAVHTDDLGAKFALVRELDGDFRGLRNDVGVGENHPVGAGDEA